MDVVCRDLRKSYGANEVLRDLTLTFRAGRVTALVGANGAGKTTLLRIVAGLQSPDSGLVSADRVLLYGGFDTMPLRGSVNGLRKALGLSDDSSRGQAKLKRMSRGQLHSVGLDIALDLNRDVLLLDEPWTALDPDARKQLTVRLRAIAAIGRVVACSTHDLDEITRVADDVAVLRNGRATVVARDAEGFDFDDLMARYRGERE